MTPLAWVHRVACPLCGALPGVQCGRSVAGEWQARGWADACAQRTTEGGLAMAADAAAGRFEVARQALEEQRERERPPQRTLADFLGATRALSDAELRTIAVFPPSRRRRR